MTTKSITKKLSSSSSSTDKNGMFTRRSKTLIVPNKKDAVFGRGRKRDNVRKGSLYRSLIEKYWLEYSELDVSKYKQRKAFVKAVIVDVLIKKGGRFIVRDGEDKYLLHPQEDEHLKLIYKKIQRALFNERKRREMAAGDKPNKTPTKTFSNTLYVSESEPGEDLEESMEDDNEDDDSLMEDEEPVLVDEVIIKTGDEEVERPRSRASIKLDQLAFLASSLLEDSEVSEDDESVRPPSPPTEARLPFKKRKSAHLESYDNLYKLLNEGTLYGGSVEFNHAWMHHLRHYAPAGAAVPMGGAFQLKPRATPFEELFNDHRFYTPSIAAFQAFAVV